MALVDRTVRGRGLALTDDSGASYDVADPPEMAGYVARGLGCAVSRDGSVRGFIVEYGEEPYGCQFCEWRFLVDLRGRFLTDARPAVLTDAGRPEGLQQYPNQDAYSRAVKHLGLVDQELDYIPVEQGDSL